MPYTYSSNVKISFNLSKQSRICCFPFVRVDTNNNGYSTSACDANEYYSFSQQIDFELLFFKKIKKCKQRKKRKKKWCILSPTGRDRSTQQAYTDTFKKENEKSWILKCEKNNNNKSGPVTPKSHPHFTSFALHGKVQSVNL